MWVTLETLLFPSRCFSPSRLTERNPSPRKGWLVVFRCRLSSSLPLRYSDLVFYPLHSLIGDQCKNQGMKSSSPASCTTVWIAGIFIRVGLIPFFFFL
ncbi:hypothetical protein DsansV1_C23g0176191 [Dioscorea sansibarensis]